MCVGNTALHLACMLGHKGQLFFCISALNFWDSILRISWFCGDWEILVKCWIFISVALLVHHQFYIDLLSVCDRYCDIAAGIWSTNQGEKCTRMESNVRSC